MAHIGAKQAIKKSWFLTEKGQTFSFHCINAINISVLLGHILPHTFLVDEYKNLLRLYSNGFSVQVPDKLNQRFQKTLELLKIDVTKRSMYSPFMACGFDMFSAGMCERFGIHIGIPANFQYDSTEGIDKSKIMVSQEPVKWPSDEGKQLLSALVMPENGQIYAMAREIKLRDSWKLCFDTFLAFVGITFTYAGSAHLNKKLNLFSKPRSVRFAGYALVASLSGLNYLMCKDFAQNWLERKIDEELKATSPVFAEGGRQFYTQILERNKALRKLMGNKGESTYTVLGNENFLIRNKHMPLVQRKEFFEEPSEAI